MRISDILKIKWKKYNKWKEEWYVLEIAVEAEKGTSLQLNNQVYFPEKDSTFTQEDFVKKVEIDPQFIKKLNMQGEDVLTQAQEFLTSLKTEKLNRRVIESFKVSFLGIWNIYLDNQERFLAIEKGRDKNISLKEIKEHMKLKADARKTFKKLNERMKELLGKQYNIPSSQLNYYTFTELVDLVRRSQRVSLSDIRTRKKYSVMAQIKGETEFFYGRGHFEKILNHVSVPTPFDRTIIKGTPASLGKVKGYVRIIREKKDMVKVKPSEIIVGVAIRPDINLSIGKCAGIVTDVGGLLSHGAILAREVGIPALVGTKIATEVLKDGDMVALNATEGYIEIIR